MAKAISLPMMVTLFAWMAAKLVSSNSETIYASVASCNATMAVAWNLKSFLKSPAISLTNRWKGSFRINSSVDFWYLRISRKATVPGRNRLTFLTPPVDGADLRAALVANCFLGALPPVDFLAVCLVLAIEMDLSDERDVNALNLIPESKSSICCCCCLSLFAVHHRPFLISVVHGTHILIGRSFNP